MPRAEAGSAKAIGNAIKAKGLTKLRFYCSICQKACRDENGYKCHIESESHMRQIAALGSNAGKTINNFSQQFQDAFVQLLRRRFGTRRVKANQVYQEYIQERHHLHMNATRWVSLSEFVKHLGKEGIAQVEEITDEGEHGWYLSWIDRSPGALARQDALQKMERAKVDEEGRMRKYLKEQIERAKEVEGDRMAGAEEDLRRRKEEEGLRRESEAKPLKIGISLTSSKAAESSDKTISSIDRATASPSGSTSTPIKLGSNPFKMKAAVASKEAPKLGGAFRAAVAARPHEAPSTSTAPTSSSARPGLTAAERIMMEEQDRREKRKMMGPQPSVKRIRM